MTGPEIDRLYERVLVLRCQAGDEAAFAEIVARYTPRLRVYLRQMLGNSDAAEDALQDVWLDTLRSVGRLEDAGAFAGWLYRVARDRAYRILRRRRRGGIRVAEIDDDAELRAGADGDAEDAFDAQAAAATLHASLDRLPLEQREVLLLRFMGEMTYEQIASAVGCGVGTVRSRLHYAKRALRREIERDERP